MAVLECINLTKWYGNVKALDGVNLALEPGRIVGLVGPNGSGKTTLIKLAQHLLTPTHGQILIGGMEPGAGTKAIVSYLPDRDFLPRWMNVESLLDFYSDFYPDFDAGRAGQMLDALQIDPLRVFKKLSKGTREKVQLIMTMSRNAAVYLLDEPIAGVDPAAHDYILRTIIGNCPENGLVLCLSWTLIAILVFAAMPMQIYAALAIGHQWIAHRILGSVLAYFGIDILKSVVNGILINAGVYTGWMGALIARSEDSAGGTAWMTRLQATMTVQSLCLIVLFSVITWFLLDRRLNLE